MPFDCNKKELRVGDKVRWCAHQRVNFTYGDQVCVIRSFSPRGNSLSLEQDPDYTLLYKWNCDNFEKIEIPHLSCIKVTPARAEKIKIINGKLTNELFVAVGRYKGRVNLLSSYNYSFIDNFTSKTLRENADAMIQLADALDKINAL